MENMGDLEKECLLVGGTAEKENDIVSSVGRVTPSQTRSHVKHNIYFASLQRFHLTIEMPSPVKLYVYDLSNGMVLAISTHVVGRQIDDIW